MNKNELLQFCRYYKGEEDCAFDDKDQNKAMFWDYERIWVERTIKKDFSLQQNENEFISIAKNLNDANPKTIDTSRPFSLVALLFNRWGHWCNGDMVSYAGVVLDFEKWYKKYYLGL